MKDLEKSVVLITRTTRENRTFACKDPGDCLQWQPEKTELEGLQREVEEAQNASVKAQKGSISGCVYRIDELKISVQDMQERVQFVVKSVDKILMMRIEE